MSTCAGNNGPSLSVLNMHHKPLRVSFSHWRRFLFLLPYCTSDDSPRVKYESYQGRSHGSSLKKPLCHTEGPQISEIKEKNVIISAVACSRRRAATQQRQILKSPF